MRDYALARPAAQRVVRYQVATCLRTSSARLDVSVAACVGHVHVAVVPDDAGDVDVGVPGLGRL
jgi:hypothetical protein